ncbi:hypothetical protein UFOVP909_145 [uncultured Caudovirales phage]|uniref:Uncharacterized protein n=1 Tax=uncultured Caudovirales phage TaxID=2100421 RepID=A0A6J7XQ87_9CAUD|nr:hypothetical protein UFOVP909_145 [uncultured Caudovirales phage]CAB4182061.1 hypothetical protein UFOVP1066_126 [uncultured Caudovirales phage]CAB4198683.1 hypothetical protein UFOVP1315_211 [uncultured Caudovirales phage]CAB4211565.1 hypothetical protein UFOVP1421_172 [uncultured Caudovirales phage]CAB5238678.1 hypothetical protein UFOVP1525_182 [uncultured Caudovirales phage]
MSTIKFDKYTIDGNHINANCVIQVVSTNNGTIINNTSGSWVDTGVSTTITPRYATSKILVIYSTCVGCYSSDAVWSSLRLIGGGSVLNHWTDSWGNSVNMYSSHYTNFSFKYLHSPNTTSSRTYSTEFLVRAGASIYQNCVNTGGGDGVLTLMEIAQ